MWRHSFEWNIFLFSIKNNTKQYVQNSSGMFYSMCKIQAAYEVFKT